MLLGRIVASGHQVRVRSSSPLACLQINRDVNCERPRRIESGWAVMRRPPWVGEGFATDGDGDGGSCALRTPHPLARPLHDRGLIIHHVPIVWGESKRNGLQVRLPSSTLEWLADVVGDQR